MKRYLAPLFAVLAAVFFSVSPAFAASSPTYQPPAIKLPSSYTDASLWATGGPQAWANGAISNASLWGLIQGYGDGSFKPGGEITRAEFAKMLAVAMGDASPDPAQMGNMTATETIFSDTPAQSWYAPYVQALSANPGGNPSANVLTSGMYPGRALGPGQPITRAEAAAWISAGLRYFGVTPSGQAQTFSDVPASGQLTVGGSGQLAVGSSGLATVNGSVYAVVPVTALQAASQAGIIKGFPDGTFQPAGLITRAQAAEMLTRFVAALPGYGQLAMQTSWINTLVTTFPGSLEMSCTPNKLYPTGNCPSAFQTDMHVAKILTNADLGFTPAASAAVWQTEVQTPATWRQIHLWLATGNLIALGEAPLTQAEASYVAGYGLEPWKVAEIVGVASQYVASITDSPLLTSLQPNAHNGTAGSGAGSFTPVSLVYLGAISQPWGGDELSLVVIESAGTQPMWVPLSAFDQNGQMIMPDPASLAAPVAKWQVNNVEATCPNGHPYIVDNGTMLSCGY